MGYACALKKAWDDVLAGAKDKHLSVKFLSDTYNIDVDKREVTARSTQKPAKEYISIILLHYIERKIELGCLPKVSGEWIDFNHLSGGEGYFPTFKKRTIDVITKKYGGDPSGIFRARETVPFKISDKGDAGVVAYPLPEVPIMINLWKADDEFGPSANILFDKTISQIFCTEDVVVLTEMVAHTI